MTMPAKTTLCTVIEAGYLELEVMLLAESLRRFGGRLAATPLVAVRPRKGPRVARSTKKCLENLDVTLIEEPTLSEEYAWWATVNKPAALGYVEEHALTPNVTWIDGDMMVLKEPSTFAPPKGYDFIARAGEASDVASSGHDEQADFWRQLCARFSLDFDAFPDIVSWPQQTVIKAYWQAGLFTYRRSLRFSQKFRAIKEGMLDGNIASKAAGTYHTDQVALALAVEAMELKSARYDPRMNFNVNPLDKAGSAKLPIGDVQIMQYHLSLWPATYPWTRALLESLPADRLEVLEKYAPFAQPKLTTRVKRKLYQLSRQKKIDAYEARVIRY